MKKLRQAMAKLPRSVLSGSAVLVFATIGTVLVVSSKAATPTVHYEAEAGTRSGNASVVGDNDASDGSAVKFGVASESCPSVGAGGFPLPDLTGWPTSCNTGPRYANTSTSASMTTSYDGQVIERVLINGSLDIRHNNVTVRDVRVVGTGPYAIDIGQDTTPCPNNINIEYIEVDMANVNSNVLPIYQRCGGNHTFDHIKVHNCSRGMQVIGGGVTVTNSYIYCHRTWPGDHRTAISSHGGSYFTVRHNTFMCVGENCSSSANMYSDYAPMSNYLFEDNLLAGGTICLRGGETHTYATETHDIRVLNNRFSNIYSPTCGIYQAFAQFDEAAPGNVRSGNKYLETGLPIEGE